MVKEMVEEKVTCSVILKRLHDFYNPTNDSEKHRDFFCGFWAGEAEKVSLGACKAAMFRPDLKKHPWKMTEIRRIAEHYHLVSLFLPTSYGGEIWITRPRHETLVQELRQLQEDSPEWHTHRARLCGIPDEEIDVEFHLRRGMRVYIG